MIAVKLAEILTRHQISQRQLSLTSGVRAAAVSLLYRGERRRIDLDQLDRILTGLQTLTGVRYDVSDVLVRVDQDQGPGLFDQDQGGPG